jgi:chemotaxis protein MotB
MKALPPGVRSGHDRWVVSYADLMTLLLALFATLYAASRVDAGKLEAAKAVVEAPQPDPVEPFVAPDHLAALQQRLQSELAHDLELTRAELSRDVRGLIVSLPERATFGSASAEVTPQARDLLARLSLSLAPLPNMVRIEGHTDDRPIRTTRFGSNWELSIARAAAVVQLLIEEQDFQPERLSAAGYGEFHPRVPNDTPENRSRNRRIDLVVEDSLDPPLDLPRAEPRGSTSR